MSEKAEQCKHNLYGCWQCGTQNETRESRLISKWKSLCRELLDTLSSTRGQWYHSVHRDRCITLIEKAEKELL